MTDRASGERDEDMLPEGPADPPPSQDLLDAFEEHGWEGDLAGALSEAPFAPPPGDTDQQGGEWRTLFEDYLRGLPGHLRDKYAIRRDG